VITESTTRAERIDQQLAKAGWSSSARQVVEELVPIGRIGSRQRPGRARERVRRLCCALLLPDGRPIAIVEAKKSSRDALAGERHAADYADRIKSIHGFDPFTFLANGNEVFFWRRLPYPTRPASGFFTREDLERLAFLDRFHEPLLGASVEPGSSTGLTRSWQLRARAMVRQVYWCPIKTVSERIETAQRRFLLVLATGTGKTRGAIALIELLRRAKIQRVLFLA
jgi:type I restriction enzyme R subunit